MEDLREPKKRIHELIDRAAAVRFDKRFDVSKYVRSGMHLQKVADLLYKDKKLEESFVYYMRFAIMFVQILPKKHPHYDKLSVDLRHTIKQSLKVIVPRCEEIKGLLLAQYEKQYQVEVEHARRKEEEASKSAAAAAADTAAAALTRLSVSDAAAEKDATADGSVDDLQWPNVASPSAPSDANDVPTSSGAAPSAPSVNRSIKPAMTSSPSVFGDLETSGFRRVLIPRTVISTFLDIAAVCTSHGVEMCGILTGKLNAEGDYQLTHLIIPKQEGTPDSCNAVGEESLAEYQIAHDLLTLGWIHTHPTQTAFLSSIDMHTQAGYQIMFPEAIAIVCAPKLDEVGVFNLTPHYGLDKILACELRGFHEHAGSSPSELFAECDGDHAHYVDDVAAGIRLQVVDLRD